MAIGIFGGYIYLKLAEGLNLFRDRVSPDKIRGGGVVLLPVILWYLAKSVSGYHNLMAAITVLIAIVGLWDDYRGVSGYVKAGITLLVGLVILWFLGWVIPIRILGYEVYVPIFNEVFWLLFFMGFVNAFNVIDGRDGVLLTTSLILLAYLYLLTADIMYLHVAAVAAGLLVWNTPPARLIMGDVGSYVLGTFITASFLTLSHIPVEARLLALSFPLMDTLTTIARRLSRRQSIFQADTEHIHHVLYSRFGDRRGLLLIMLINLASVGLSALYLKVGPSILPLGLVWWALLAAISFILPKRPS
ncbi:MAG: undecaprenyl/decaprenyl-phosphate alpha-N-acetylglucosaminyl 1-phosphate transferase [Thermotogae bacterium]|nr:undecaprenyl/decaprenyl-phosphate alpha-N-acetylglucosaminyl 1-phosphate transferase [Thermotogota bacterium]